MRESHDFGAPCAVVPKWWNIKERLRNLRLASMTY
jgi:hypothetical protein